MLPKGRIFATLEFTYEILSDENLLRNHLQKALQSIPIPETIYESFRMKGAKNTKYYKEVPIKIKVTYNNKVITWAVALSRVGSTDAIAEMQRGRQYRNTSVITRRKKDVKLFPSSRRPELRKNEKKAIEYMYRELNLGCSPIGRALNIDPPIIVDYIRELGIMRSRSAPIKKLKLKEK
jgi:hypothetical protein